MSKPDAPACAAITDADLARWARLADAATRGPWHVDNDLERMSAAWVERVEPDENAPQPPAIAQVFTGTGEAPQGGREDLLVANAWGPPVGEMQHQANAAFIAESRTAVPALVAEVQQLRKALRDLVESLPKCTLNFGDVTGCENPATRAWLRGGDRYCDVHGTDSTNPAKHVPEYPRAAPLRTAIALLKGSTP